MLLHPTPRFRLPPTHRHPIFIWADILNIPKQEYLVSDHRATCIKNTTSKTEVNLPVSFIFSLGLRRHRQANLPLPSFGTDMQYLGDSNRIHTCLPVTNALAAEVELTTTASSSTRLTPAKIRNSTNSERIVGQSSTALLFEKSR